MKPTGKILRAIIMFIICIFTTGYLFSHYDSRKYRMEDAQDYVKRVCEIGNVPGMSVAVLDDGQEAYINVGYADKEKKTEMTNEIRCELGSTTKAFTALGILLLEQDGKLSRGDFVANYLPWFCPTYDGREAEITIEQLLCHTSGIPVWTIAQLPAGTADDERLLEHTVQKIRSVRLEYMPGTVHHYATVNYDVLALIMETVSGMRYEAYIEEYVLEPLGMADSYFRVDDSKPERSAQGYRYAFSGAGPYDAPTFYGNTAAGYLVSDTKDLSLWMKAQMGRPGTELPKKLEHAIAASHSYPVTEEQHYFAGWNLYDTCFCHSGNNPNFSSQVIAGTINKKAVFALANMSGSAPTKAAGGLYRMMQGGTAEIGLWVDGSSLVDFICCIACLTEIYVMILLFEKGGQKRHAGRKVFLCLLMAAIVPAVPYILHYSYFMLAVWCPPCLLLAIAGAEICFAEYIVLCIRNRKNRKENEYVL